MKKAQKIHIALLRTIIDSQNHSIDMDEAREAIENLKFEIDSNDDFFFELDGNEYRIINDKVIWDTYKEEIQELIEDCYSDVLNLDKIPDFISINVDWEKTAQNAFADGYGHHFSGYDGSEENVTGTDHNGNIFDYWIFRTN